MKKTERKMQKERITEGKRKNRNTEKECEI